MANDKERELAALCLAAYEEHKDVARCARCDRKFRKYDKRHIFFQDEVVVCGPLCHGCRCAVWQERFRYLEW